MHAASGRWPCQRPHCLKSGRRTHGARLGDRRNPHAVTRTDLAPPAMVAPTTMPPAAVAPPAPMASAPVAMAKTAPESDRHGRPAIAVIRCGRINRRHIDRRGRRIRHRRADRVRTRRSDDTATQQARAQRDCAQCPATRSVNRNNAGHDFNATKAHETSMAPNRIGSRAPSCRITTAVSVLTRMASVATLP